MVAATACRQICWYEEVLEKRRDIGFINAESAQIRRQRQLNTAKQSHRDGGGGVLSNAAAGAYSCAFR